MPCRRGGFRAVRRLATRGRGTRSGEGEGVCAGAGAHRPGPPLELLELAQLPEARVALLAPDLPAAPLLVERGVQALIEDRLLRLRGERRAQQVTSSPGRARAEGWKPKTLQHACSHLGIRRQVRFLSVRGGPRSSSRPLPLLCGARVRVRLRLRELHAEIVEQALCRDRDPDRKAWRRRRGLQTSRRARFVRAAPS